MGYLSLHHRDLLELTLGTLGCPYSLVKSTHLSLVKIYTYDLSNIFSWSLFGQLMKFERYYLVFDLLLRSRKNLPYSLRSQFVWREIRLNQLLVD